MHITFLGHATVAIELDGVRIVTDPILRMRVAHLRRHPVLATAALEDLDAVLLSHAHGDHLDPPSIRKLPGQPLVIAPAGLGGLLARRRVAPVSEIEVGATIRVGALAITAFEADHDGRRTPVATTRAAALGYLIRGSQSVYFAGDTGLHDDMARARCRGDRRRAGSGGRLGPDARSRSHGPPPSRRRADASPTEGGDPDPLGHARPDRDPNRPRRLRRASSWLRPPSWPRTFAAWCSSPARSQFFSSLRCRLLSSCLQISAHTEPTKMVGMNVSTR